MSEKPNAGTFEVGDRVRIDIPDETDPKHNYHGKNGEVISVIGSDRPSGEETPAIDLVYRVELDIGGTVDVAAEYLRPPI